MRRKSIVIKRNRTRIQIFTCTAVHAYRTWTHHNIGIFAQNEEKAREKIICHFVLKNPGTKKDEWEIQNLKVVVPREGTSLRDAVALLQDSGTRFIGIDI